MCKQNTLIITINITAHGGCALPDTSQAPGTLALHLAMDSAGICKASLGIAMLACRGILRGKQGSDMASRNSGQLMAHGCDSI